MCRQDTHLVDQTNVTVLLRTSVTRLPEWMRGAMSLDDGQLELETDYQPPPGRRPLELVSGRYQVPEPDDWLSQVCPHTEMGRRVAAFDWAATSLGAPPSWPIGLRTAVAPASLGLARQGCLAGDLGCNRPDARRGAWPRHSDLG